MTIQEQINADMIASMKAKDKEKLSILRVIMGEFSRVDKEVSDDKATAIIKKMVQNAREVKNESEAMIMESYLPKQLSQSELRNVIELIIVNEKVDPIKGIGVIMGALQKEYAGQYDGKLASQIIRELLN